MLSQNSLFLNLNTVFQQIQKTAANGLQKALYAFKLEAQTTIAESSLAETSLPGNL